MRPQLSHPEKDNLLGVAHVVLRATLPATRRYNSIYDSIAELGKRQNNEQPGGEYASNRIEPQTTTKYPLDEVQIQFAGLNLVRRNVECKICASKRIAKAVSHTN